MNKSFFKGMTDQNIILYANFDKKSQGEKGDIKNIKEALAHLDSGYANIGDTSLEVVEEDASSVTYLSTDTRIKVEVKVNKASATALRTKEVA